MTTTSNSNTLSKIAPYSMTKKYTKEEQIKKRKRKYKTERKGASS